MESHADIATQSWKVEHICAVQEWWPSHHAYVCLCHVIGPCILYTGGNPLAVNTGSSYMYSVLH